MIRIKNLTVKNFMSIGNVAQAVNFESGSLTLVLGENLDQGGESSGYKNGTGKTSILNALSFALYGNALTNIKKDNLINKINNKGMLVTLCFEKNGVEYRIERGRKPNIMRFFVNDKEQLTHIDDDSQGDIRETQKDIDNLLGMSHDMFKHILALNTYTEPFLSMRVNDQRLIIEQLLGITLLSEKADSLREEIRKTKDLLLQETTNIEATKKSNEKISQSITSLKLKQSAWNNQKQVDIKKLENSINELKSVDIDKELKDHSDLKAYLESSTKLKSLKKEQATLESAVAQAEKSLVSYQKNLEMFEQKTCPLCEQGIHNDSHEQMLEKAVAQLKESQDYYQKVSTGLAKVQEQISKLSNIGSRPSVFYETVEEALRHQNNLATLELALANKIIETDPYQEQIDDLEQTALQTISWDTVNSLTKLKDHQDFLLKLLTNKDSFIRKKIIDQNLSYLNSRLTYYIDKMGLPHQVKFKNDLTVEITQLGQDLDFDNLSRGERNRLILGLSWSFRDVWESLYQNINLMFIDELIDNGLDSNGVENALGILKKMARERNKNIYLVSHRDELIGRVNHVLKVVKCNGFTEYSNDVEVI